MESSSRARNDWRAGHRTQMSVLGNAGRRVNDLHTARTASQGRMFGVATAWTNTTVKACGLASDSANNFQISLGNPIILWFDKPHNFTRRRLAAGEPHLVWGAVGAIPPQESLRPMYRSDEATLEKAPPRLPKVNSPHAGCVRKSLRFHGQSGEGPIECSSTKSGANLGETLVRQRIWSPSIQ
jgi:hypothetical protein